MKKIYSFIFTVVVLVFSGCSEVQPVVTMHNAARAGDIQSIDELLKQGHNVDEPYFGTSLIWAAEAGQMQTVKYLLEKGANIDARAEQGWTPLGNALYMNKTEVSDYLLQKGANIDNVLVGFDAWTTYCKNINSNECTSKLPPLQKYLQDIKAKKQAKIDDAKKAQEQTLIQQEVDKLLTANDYNGLKAYTEKNPNAVYYIKDEVMRLALTGPKGLKVGDIREYLQNGKSERILLSMIKQQEVPYKKFTLEEIDVLLDMGLTEEIVAALIDETTELLRNEKLKQQQDFYLAEQKKVAAQPQTVVYQNTQAPQQEQNPVVNKVQDEVIKQGVGILLDQLFHR